MHCLLSETERAAVADQVNQIRAGNKSELHGLGKPSYSVLLLLVDYY